MDKKQTLIAFALIVLVGLFLNYTGFVSKSVTTTQISVTPKQIEQGGIIKIKIIPGHLGADKYMNIYKIKSGQDLRRVKYQYCQYEGNTCKKTYEFNYKLSTSTEFESGQYFIQVEGDSGTARAYFTII